MTKKASSTLPVDLVIVIDTSPSMKDEAQALSEAAASAIAKAKTSCPSDLRVVWLGIEGTWKGTNFDQTIRAYLTQKCKVAESKLRGRRRGELESAGAQEDAARAIEDISDYFDWRSGAARAIFYLGDEALEGGGDKTEQKDILAANLAIQKAQGAGVSVHTYFGTSKSKHQEGIKTEYTRVATSTGGQSFTSKDSVSGFSGVLEKVICGSRTAKTVKLKPGAVYIQDCVSNELSKLYTLDLVTGKATFISEIVTEISDIAFVGSQLYGLDREGDKTQLVKIDLNSGDATVIGNILFACSGLAYHRQRQTLYATTAKQLIAINLETSKGTIVATVADKNYNCGEVAFDAEGKAYITLIGYDKKKSLASCNLDTGEVKTIGNIGFADLASMEFVGDVLYGVTGNFFNLGKDGQLIRIDTTTGKGTLVATTDPAGRWAGITVYEPATVVTTESTPVVNTQETSEKTKVLQETKATREEGMSILTIDTKNNCYVIDPNQMNNLQQDVAKSFSLEKGTFDIRIAGGRYSYSKSTTEGEPFVLLWIYGVDGRKFINKTTGYEVGATWTTLNGYNDNLQLEIKDKAVVCALFFDFNNNDNSGSIELLISSNKPFFNPQSLTVDSKRNSYILDENYLSGLKQSGANSVELNPGNYRIKIREGSASYWSESKKFEIEPWALIWAKGGKFTPKLTDIEVEETWLSLNGLKDEVVLEVKEKTTLSGFFFDTHKDDNEGQIILAIEQLSANELAQKKQDANTTRTVTTQGQTTTTRTVTTQGQTTTTTEGTGGYVRREPVGASSSIEFTFRFNEEEFKKKWEEQLQQIDASIKVIDEEDVTLEAKYWDQLEQWLLKNYEKHFKNLAVEVAKVRFTMDAYIQQMEFGLNQHLQTLSVYLDRLLEDRINVEISKRINQVVNQRVDQIFEQKISSNVELIINSIINKPELNQYISRHVDQQFDQTFEQKIRSNVGLIINNIVNKQELNQHIDRQVNQQVDQTFEQKIRSNINAITQNLVNNNADLDRYVGTQIDNSFEQKLLNNIQLLTQNIINNNEALNLYIDQRLHQGVINNAETSRDIINLVTNSGEINSKVVNLISNSSEINNKINNLRSEWNQTFVTLATQHVDQLIDVISGRETFNRAITQNLINNNAELNQYVSQQIDNSYEQKLQNNIRLITQNIVNNNEELNRYIDQRFQQSVTNSSEINNKIGSLRNEWNQTFLNLATQHVDQLIGVISGRETFNQTITQKLINNNAELNQYVSQQIDNSYEQKLQNNIRSLTQNIINNNEELNRYIDQRFQQSITNNTEINHEIVNIVTNSNEINNKIANLRNEWNQTFLNLATQHVDQLINVIGGRDTFNRVLTQKIVNNTDINQYVSRQIDNSYEQKIQNNIQLLTQNIVNNNEELNRYIDQRFQQSVTNNTEINNEIVNLVTNSSEINNKINNLYRDIDTKIENVRNEWNRTFINLVTQNVDQLINLIGGRDTFNIQIANSINVKVDELLNEILRIKNEMTVLMNNADRHLYEWTLGELMAIKGCLTDRQVLVEQLVTFSAELRTKLDSTNCVDINTFRPFRPISMDAQLSPAQPQQLPGS
ncbi:hypothetical protein [Iningainema tapete]|uniref:VWFA domain-containing protein n=1 Tax=Iningainema tapete BLCC-T55 TaxID=2748662 RepID=A0A8J6XGY8_9CYAN|nr:hypothetical protein [Iningainema tapete]MBD2774113.1 hypothetical protein [Iningainema tapete BLCC-T55]